MEALGKRKAREAQPPASDVAETLPFNATQVASDMMDTSPVVIDDSSPDKAEGEVCRSLARDFSSEKLSPTGSVHYRIKAVLRAYDICMHACNIINAWALHTCPSLMLNKKNIYHCFGVWCKYYCFHLSCRRPQRERPSPDGSSYPSGLRGPTQV